MGFPVLKVYVDKNGKVLKVTDMLDRDLTDDDYCPKEVKRINKDGILASVNWCCWKLINGGWVCGPCE